MPSRHNARQRGAISHDLCHDDALCLSKQERQASELSYCENVKHMQGLDRAPERRSHNCAQPKDAVA